MRTQVKLFIGQFTVKFTILYVKGTPPEDLPLRTSTPIATSFLFSPCCTELFRTTP